MKVDHHAVHVVDSHGLGEQRKFQILANAHSFRILSSGLYSDKISACLRELGCNAADSHIAAGIPERPIEVKLPTKLDREFYIRDFGTGLSHEDIEQLYTTYFSSNKSTNNEQTGAFGLGSKSPFSYTDSFAVTTAQAGVQRAYTAYIGSDGSPVIALLDEQPAQDAWPHGLMVSFPVKPEDASEFERKAREIFQWFQVKPVFPGDTQSPYCDPERVLSGTNFFFVKGGSLGFHDHARHRHHSVAMVPHIMSGNVAYRLDGDELDCKEEFVRLLISAGIQLRMPLGTVMPTASREALEYNPRTRSNVLNALRAAAREIAERLRSELDQPAGSDWERRHRAAQFLASQVPSQIASELPSLLKVLDLPQAEEDRIRDFYETRRLPLPEWVGGDVYHPKTPPAVLDRAASYRVWWAYNQRDARKPMRRHAVERGTIKLGKRPEKACVQLDQALKIFFSDAPHAYQRIEAEIRKNPQLAVLMVAPAYPEAQAGLTAYSQRLAQELGGVLVEGVSSLPAPSRGSQVRSGGGSRPKLKPSEKAAAYAQEEVRFWNCRPDRELPSRIAFGSVPTDAHYYLPAPTTSGGSVAYIPEEGGHPVLKSDLQSVVQAFRALRALGVPVPEVGGFIAPEGPQARKFKLKEKGWKPLLQVMHQSLSDPAVITAIQSKLVGLPDLDLERARRYYYGGESVAGFLGSLVRQAHQSFSLREWLTQQELELPALAALTKPLWDANVACESHAMADKPVQALINTLHWRPDITFDRLTSEGYLTQVFTKHPELRFLDGDSFEASWNQDPQGAARLLRLIFAQ